MGGVRSEKWETAMARWHVLSSENRERTGQAIFHQLTFEGLLSGTRSERNRFYKLRKNYKPREQDARYDWTKGTPHPGVRIMISRPAQDVCIALLRGHSPELGVPGDDFFNYPTPPRWDWERWEEFIRRRGGRKGMDLTPDEYHQLAQAYPILAPPLGVRID